MKETTSELAHAQTKHQKLNKFYEESTKEVTTTQKVKAQYLEIIDQGKASETELDAKLQRLEKTLPR